MSDPLSIAGSVAGLISIGSSILIAVNNLRNAIVDAPQSIALAQAEVQSLCAILTQLDTSLRCNSSALSPIPPHVLNDLNGVLQNCREVELHFWTILQPYVNAHVDAQANAKTGKVKTGLGHVKVLWTRFRWAVGAEKEIDTIRKILEAHKSTLGLTLMLISNLSMSAVLDRTENTRKTTDEMSGEVVKILTSMGLMSIGVEDMREKILDLTEAIKQNPQLIAESATGKIDTGEMIRRYLESAATHVDSMTHIGDSSDDESILVSYRKEKVAPVQHQAAGSSTVPDQSPKIPQNYRKEKVAPVQHQAAGSSTGSDQLPKIPQKIAIKCTPTPPPVPPKIAVTKQTTTPSTAPFSQLIHKWNAIHRWEPTCDTETGTGREPSITIPRNADERFMPQGIKENENQKVILQSHAHGLDLMTCIPKPTFLMINSPIRSESQHPPVPPDKKGYPDIDGKKKDEKKPSLPRKQPAVTERTSLVNPRPNPLLVEYFELGKRINLERDPNRPSVRVKVTRSKQQDNASTSAANSANKDQYAKVAESGRLRTRTGPSAARTVKTTLPNPDDTSLLIEHFESGKRLDPRPVRPSARVKLPTKRQRDVPRAGASAPHGADAAPFRVAVENREPAKWEDKGLEAERLEAEGRQSSENGSSEGISGKDSGLGGAARGGGGAPV